MSDFNEKFKEYIAYTEEKLRSCNCHDDSSAAQKDLIDAMNYSLEAGGKRIRPVLVYAFCEACGGDISKAAAPAAGSQNITSPMPGSILGIKVNGGDKVTAGQTVILLEAMKMENEIVAPVDGTIASINVKTGDTVDTDQVLATLK